jgi:hypothetical protein
MKKLTTIFLILFAFSNNIFASFFGDIFRGVGGYFTKEYAIVVTNVRCKVEYTQLDLTTGIEKSIKHTAQFYLFHLPNGGNVCYLSTQDLSDKINEWLNESDNNVVANMTVVNCKERITYNTRLNFFKTEQRWNEYKSCDDEFNAHLVDWLERPKQLGYNVHKERLIRDYEEGFFNHYGDPIDE